jgi:HlyD family secretion protein
MKVDPMRNPLCALALAACLLPLSACSDDPPPVEKKETARAVTVAEVTLRPISGRASATGLLVPREEAAVGVELSGFRVKSVLVEEGAQVKAGQPLALLDDTLLRARVAQARATYEQERSQAARVAGLEGSGVLSDEEIALRHSQAAVAKAQLDDLNAQAARMTVRAPVSGLVIERNVRPGAVSGGGDPMFRIARDGLIELDAEVPEDALATIEEGTPAQVTLPGGETFAGEVRLISPRIDPQTKLGRVRVRLPVDPALRAGGFASASFQREAQPVPAVPEKAVQFEASGPLVTVIDADNRAKRMSIRTGARADGYVELVEGPPVGTRVALGGGAFLLDGDLVDPVAASGEAAKAQEKPKANTDAPDAAATPPAEPDKTGS